MPKCARTHSESRRALCCACGGKVTDSRVVNQHLEPLVKEFIYPRYSLDNESHPTGIYTTCRKTLDSLAKVFFVQRFCFYNYDMLQDPSTSRKLPPLLKYDDIRGPPPPTRAVASQSCPCTVYELAQLKTITTKCFGISIPIM